MDLYTKNALLCSEITTKKYSTSFSLGIRLFNKRHRAGIYAVYGFVRFADEIVDSFHGHDKEKLLADFREMTFEAIKQGISTNPILHSFQWVVNKFHIDEDLIEAFFVSMQMDISKKSYTRNEYQEYIYGSAEVVGLMCMRVFYSGDDTGYRNLLQPARKLGEAFQKVNFLRDLKADWVERGRIYFPGVSFDTFSSIEKTAIEQEIIRDFEASLPGIRSLSGEFRLGVYLAYRYYLELLKRIASANPQELTSERLRVSSYQKSWLLIKCWLRHITGTI